MFTDSVLLDLLLIAAGGVVTGYLFTALDVAKERVEAWRKGPPAKWQVRFFDPNGIPTRTESLSAKGIGRLLEDINRGFYA